MAMEKMKGQRQSVTRFKIMEKKLVEFVEKGEQVFAVLNLLGQTVFMG